MASTELSDVAIDALLDGDTLLVVVVTTMGMDDHVSSLQRLSLNDGSVLATYPLQIDEPAVEPHAAFLQDGVLTLLDQLAIPPDNPDCCIAYYPWVAQFTTDGTRIASYADPEEAGIETFWRYLTAANGSPIIAGSSYGSSDDNGRSFLRKYAPDLQTHTTVFYDGIEMGALLEHGGSLYTVERGWIDDYCPSPFFRVRQIDGWTIELDGGNFARGGDDLAMARSGLPAVIGYHAETSPNLGARLHYYQSVLDQSLGPRRYLLVASSKYTTIDDFILTDDGIAHAAGAIRSDPNEPADSLFLLTRPP